MESLLERLEWVVKNRAGNNQRELARRARLDHETAIGVILHRLRKNARADVERETLIAIARAANVSLAWLAEGEGEPENAVDFDQSTPDHDAGDPSAAADPEPVFGNLPNWPALLAGAKKMKPGHDPWVWEATAELRPLAPDPTVATVADASDYAAKHAGAPPPGTRDLRRYYRERNESVARDVRARIAEWVSRARGSKPA